MNNELIDEKAEMQIKIDELKIKIEKYELEKIKENLEDQNEIVYIEILPEPKLLEEQKSFEKNEAISEESESMTDRYDDFATEEGEFV